MLQLGTRKGSAPRVSPGTERCIALPVLRRRVMLYLSAHFHTRVLQCCFLQPCKFQCHGLCQQNGACDIGKSCPAPGSAHSPSITLGSLLSLCDTHWELHSHLCRALRPSGGTKAMKSEKCGSPAWFPAGLCHCVVQGLEEWELCSVVTDRGTGI